VLGDVDEWYLDGKRTAAEFNGTAAPSHDRRNTLLLAKDVVSFHYVSEVEARLLYDLLGADAASVHPATSGLRAGLAKGTIGDSLLPICPKKHPHPGKESVAVPCSSAREIRALWPDSDERAGHYSRPLSRGPTGLHEADLLYNYLSQVQVSKPPC
jgi:class 3 adenylate cyclase